MTDTRKPDPSPAQLTVVVQVRRMLADGSARELRERNGISLRAMGEAAGTTGPTVWKWEQRRRVPRFDAALRLGVALGALIAAEAA